MQVSPIQQTQNQNSNPTFGVHYTKKTVTRLKKLIPDIVRATKSEQDYDILKSAFEHLIQAGKNVDGFVVDINDNYLKGFQYLDIRVQNRHGKVKDFLYPDSQYDANIFCGGGEIPKFYNKCKLVNSPEFLQDAVKTIDKWATHRASQSKWKNFKDDMFWVWNDVTEFFEDGFDTFMDLFRFGINLDTGKTFWVPLEDAKIWLTRKGHAATTNNQNAAKIKELRALVDKMRTRPIDVDIRFSEAKPDKLLESPKLIEKIEE